MYSEIETNTQVRNEPPMPPPAHFDLEQVVAARPVQRLSPWQKIVGRLQRIFGPHVLAVAVITAGSVIGFTAATSAIDLAAPAESANQGDSVASTGQSSAEEATVAGEVEPAVGEPGVTIAPEATVHRPTRRVIRAAPPIDLRRTLPPIEVDEDVQNQKPRPRLVSVIH